MPRCFENIPDRTSTPESIRAVAHCHCSSYVVREDFLTNEFEFQADLFASASDSAKNVRTIHKKLSLVVILIEFS